MVTVSNIVPKNRMRFLFKSLSTAVLASTFCLSVSAMSIAIQNTLAFDFYKQLRSQRPTGNVICSPYSLKSCLSMVYLGAAGETKNEIGKVLCYQGKSDQEVLDGIKQTTGIFDSITQNESLQMQVIVANNLFVDKNYKLNAKFATNCKKYFGADLVPISLASPEAKQVINKWVSQKTKGKIPTIIDQTSGATKLMLVNALYFSAVWGKEFDPKLTKQEPFYTKASVSKKVPMMHISGRFRYAKGKDFQCVALPYQNPRFVMFVILPSRTSSVSKVDVLTDKLKWDAMRSSLRVLKGDLSLPRFKLSENFELITPLNKMGATAMFEPAKSNLSGMVDGKTPLSVGSAVQKVFLDVNEKGTVGAAATEIGGPLGGPELPPETFKMVVNRPFVVALYNTEREEMLFAGHVTDIQK